MKKTELALLYFPHSQPATARRRLMRWISSCPPLMEELGRTGFYNRQKALTVRQVHIVYLYLGEP